jgi:hypothetical protein
MPRLRVIVLDETRDDPDTYNVLFWADVPPARQSRYADPAKVSAWAGATQADNDALKSGAVVEQAGVARHAQGTGIAAIQGFLQQRWQDYQTFITNNNPWQRYGSTWDGTAWVMANNG